MPPGYEILQSGAQKIFKCKHTYSERGVGGVHLQCLQNKCKQTYNYIYKTSQNLTLGNNLQNLTFRNTP